MISYPLEGESVNAYSDACPTGTSAAGRDRAAPALGEYAATDSTDNGKLAARVARQIEQDVLRTGWPVGEVLGSETELRERYQVSRAVLREAIRLVEHHQVAAMRRGPSGGLVVRAPDAGAATSAMMVYLEFVGTTIEHLLTARLMIEPLAAALAAANITEPGIAQVRTALADEFAAGPNRDGHVRGALHLTLAEVSGNPALQLFVDVLLRLTWRYASDQLSHLPDDPDHPAFTSSDSSHEAIVHAVVAGDGPRAQYLAVQHLEMFGEFLISWRPESRNLPSWLWAIHTPGRTQEQKLAEVVAQRLLGEITGGGWEVGSVIGSEGVLLDRFGVSRAVLREAVRLLEYHSVARMRRGPGGGLVVAEPAPGASIEAIALYLDYQGIEVEHLRAVREAVELACLNMVAARVGDPEVARRLQRLRDGVGTLDPGGDRTRPPNWDEPFLHVELAELAGNPVLALFLRILITLWLRQEEPEPEEPRPEATGDDAHSHRGIIDALLLGDGDLARHRMRRHLTPRQPGRP
jgi:DNA-binding FadR family transcriptional regulator